MDDIPDAHQASDAVNHVLKNFLAVFGFREAHNRPAFAVWVNAGGFDNSNLLIGVMLQKQRRASIQPSQPHAAGFAIKNLGPEVTGNRGLGRKAKLNRPRVRRDGGAVNLEVALKVLADGGHLTSWPEIDFQSSAAMGAVGCCGGGGVSVGNSSP